MGLKLCISMHGHNKTGYYTGVEGIYIFCKCSKAFPLGKS